MRTFLSLSLLLFAVACGASETSSATETPAAPDPGKPAETTPVVEPTHGPTGPFTLSDVSVLFPLPPSGRDTLLKATTEGDHGALIPLALFSEMPALVPGSVGPGGGPATGTQKLEEHARLRAVAMRVDPCFPSLSLPADQCRRQVRLVFQMMHDIGERWSAVDVGVHAFYDLPAADFDRLARRLDALKKTIAAPRGTAPLDVHPTLAKEGLEGTYAKGLFAIVLKEIGAARLVRLTMMALPQDQAEWSFQGFDVKGGKLLPIGIAGTKTTEQAFHVLGYRDPVDPKNVVLGGMPMPAIGDDLALDALLGPHGDNAPPPSEDALAKAAAAAVRIENPTKHHAEDTSCVACHTAGPARERYETKAKRSLATHPEAFTSAFDLTSTTTLKGDLKSLRAFGYRGSVPVLSQRVIHESAAVASAMSKTYGP